MSTVKIGEQIAFLRKQQGLTQEEVANILGVTNQAVSKWESAQCCPDIGLLPKIAEMFHVSVDELLGYDPASAEADMIASCRRRIAELPKNEDLDFAFRMAAALHAAIFHKYMVKDNSGWSVDDVSAHAEKGEWGYSSVVMPKLTTTMVRGTILFSCNGDMITESTEPYRIASKLKSFENAENLKIASAIYRLTVQDETAYASAEDISKSCGLPEEEITGRLQESLAPFVMVQYAPTRAYRFGEAYLDLVPILSLLGF